MPSSFVVRTASIAASIVLVAGCASVLGIDTLSSQEGGAVGNTSSTGGGSGTTGLTTATTSTGTTGSTGTGTATATTGGGSSTSSTATGSVSTSTSTGTTTGTTGNSATGSDGGTGDGGTRGTGTTGSVGSTGSVTTGSTSTSTGGTTASDGGTRDGGTTASTGADAGKMVAVKGTIIDFWRQPWPSVPVTITQGDVKVTTLVTGSDGTFTAMLPVPYDVSFNVQSRLLREGWRYEGLTIANPILQTEDMRDDTPSTYSMMTFTGLAADGSEHAEFTFGSPVGASSSYDWYSGDQSVSWNDLASTTGTVHVLRWKPSAMPVAFLGYDSKPLSVLDNATAAALTFNLTTAVPSGTVSGTVTPSATIPDISVDAYLTFTDNGRISLYSSHDSTASHAFSFTTPNVQGGTISIVAKSEANGKCGNWPCLLASKHGLAATTSNVPITLPEQPLLVAPADGNTYNEMTDFIWTGPNAVYVTDVAFYVDAAAISHTRFHVVTTNKTAKIPVAATGLSIPKLTTANDAAWWRVGYRGAYTSVDQAAAAPMLDAFDYFLSYDGNMDGIDDRDSVHAWAAGRGLTPP